jgi:hypothetical protein
LIYTSSPWKKGLASPGNTLVVNEMKRNSLLSVFGLAIVMLSDPSIAETYEDGHAAYDSGDYAAAFQIWKSLADQGSPSAQYAMVCLEMIRKRPNGLGWRLRATMHLPNRGLVQCMTWAAASRRACPKR